MALVSDIQLQDKTVKPHTIDVDCHFTFAGLTASTALAISCNIPVSTTGMFTAKSPGNVCAFFETAWNNVDIYLNIDKATDDPTDNPYWALRASGTASDSFIIANSKGANSTCQYSALSITPAGGVGVGKTGATSVLDISAADSSTASINITNTADNVGAKLSTGSSSIAMGSTTNHNLNLQTNSVDRVTLDTNGNLGIGTVTPAALLDVRGSAIFNEDAASVDFRVEGSNVENLLFVDGSADRVGIGTSTPSSLLHTEKNHNGTTDILIKNTTAGTAAQSVIQVNADAGIGSLKALSSSYTTSNQAIADSVLLESDSTSSGGLQISAAGTNEVGLWTNSTRRATLTSGGCLGLGVSTPDGLLHIYSGNAGSVAASSGGCNLVIENSAHGGVSILTPDASTGSIIFGSPSDSIGAEIKHTQSSTTMEVGTRESGGILKLNSDDGTNAIYIDASQNVGIGTDSSSVPLRVQGDACFTGTINAYCVTGGGASLWLSDTDLIYTTGNCVGIGTSTATADLHIMKDQNATTDILIANNTAGAAAISQLNVSSDTALGHLTTFSGTYTTSGSSIADAVRLGSDSTASGGLHISAGGANEIGFWTNNTRKVTITSGGCVGIGTADTDDEELKVEGDICTTGTMYAQAFSGGGVTDNVWIMNGQDAYYKELSAGDNIGLGTTTPGHTLHVGGNAASAPALLVCDSGGAKIEVNNGQVKIHNAICLPSTDGTVNQVLCTDGSGALGWGPGGYWGCDGSANLNYTSGNVGIGTATPSHTLDVEGVAHAATCIVSADLCATTKVVGAVVCSAGVLCTATDLCAGADVHAATCIVTPQICGTSQVTTPILCSTGAVISATGHCGTMGCFSQCVCATQCIKSTTCIFAGGCVCGGGAVHSPCIVASSCMCVAVSPANANHVANKNYVDTQITANAKGMCCAMNFAMTLPSPGNSSQTLRTAVSGLCRREHYILL